MAKRLQRRTLSSNASSARLQTRTTLRADNTGRNTGVCTVSILSPRCQPTNIAMRRRRRRTHLSSPVEISSVPIFRVGMETPRTDDRPLAPLHDTRQVGIQYGHLVNSLLPTQPTAHSGRHQWGVPWDRFVSNLVNLPSHLVGKLGDVALA